MSVYCRKGDPDGLKILLAAALSGKKIDMRERNGESSSSLNTNGVVHTHTHTLVLMDNDGHYL